jgi:hypothetical protein
MRSIRKGFELILCSVELSRVVASVKIGFGQGNRGFVEGVRC